METSDLTIRILQEIRDEQRATRTELKAEVHELKGEMHELRGEMHEMNERFQARFEVLETTLRDLAQQMVMLSRGIKTALEARTDYERRISDLECRVDILEKPAH